jgi:hypothetical protein
MSMKPDPEQSGLLAVAGMVGDQEEVVVAGDGAEAVGVSSSGGGRDPDREQQRR